MTADSDFFGHFSGTGFASIFDSNGESGLYPQIFILALNCWQVNFHFILLIYNIFFVIDVVETFLESLLTNG